MTIKDLQDTIVRDTTINVTDGDEEIFVGLLDDCPDKISRCEIYEIIIESHDELNIEVFKADEEK